MIGTTLSHYVIESRLGKGGMGEVYLARDTRLGRLVAIKILPAEVKGADERVRRFVNEAKAASALNHPNIVTIHEIDRDGDVPFIVMEHIDGAPLRERFSSQVSKDEFIDRAVQMANALGVAHAAGIVHRDLKPENIMLTRSGQVKLVDFGLARQSPAAIASDAATAKMDDPVITSPGVIVGTVGYMSPEQVNGFPADARSDVFSLGVVFFEMLTGRPAFRGDSAMATLASILRDAPPSLKTLRPDLPASLVGIVERCLEKDPAKRFANGGELHRALAAIEAVAAAAPRHTSRIAVAVVSLVAVAAIAAGAVWWSKESKRRWVRDTAIPEIQKLAESDEDFAAIQLLNRARAVSADDPELKQLYADLSFPVMLESVPPGATIEARAYRTSQPNDWIPLGTAPREARIPIRTLVYRVSLAGYDTIEVSREYRPGTISFVLRRTGETPEGMVYVPGGKATVFDTSVDMPEFFIDKYELSNAEYMRFVDDGGYRRPELWKHPFNSGDRTFSWDEAMREFVDRTGRPGPAGWELGTYPDGQGEYPVDGISWYEAAAYAVWAGKSLPTVFHWHRAAQPRGSHAEILMASNFSGKGPHDRSRAAGVGPSGAYDMAGNVKEWCANATGAGRYTMGGSWSDAAYQYGAPDSDVPMARHAGLGMRLVREVSPAPPEAHAEVIPQASEPRKPVDDATFEIMARLYDYDPKPLNSSVDEVKDDHAAWRMERVSFDAAYGGERVPVYLYIPRNAKPPYQTVVFFPGSDAITLTSSRDLWLRMLEFYVRSGRVLAYPVYKGTYERQVARPEGPNALREIRIQQAQDVRRTLDYLESRSDIDRTKILYYGLSWGAVFGPLPLAVDKRISAAVLFAGGLRSSTAPPEVDNVNFLPRVSQPTLLVAGRDDFIFPYETSQVPFFELIGTDPSKKRHAVIEGGHVPSEYNAVVRECIDWADRWLGPVAR